MPYIEANGLTYRYRVTGQGPPLLMLRGLVRCMDFWLDFEPLMRRRHTVICVDNRGVGGTSKPLGLYTTAGMADDTAAVVRGLRFEQVDLFGISLGGMIAQQLLIRHPGLVRRAVLGCTQPGGRLAKRPAPAALGNLASALVRHPRDANRMSLPMLLSADFLARRPDIEARWYELLERWPVRRHVLLAQLAAAATHRAAEDLPRVRTPTLLLHGDADRLIPPANSEVLSGLIPGARLEWIRGAGHDFPTEQPEEVSRLIGDFVLGG